MMHVPVLLIRILRVDGKNLVFLDNQHPTEEKKLPLAESCHVVANRLQKYQLCKATVHDGTIIDLVRMPTKGG